MPKPSSTNTTSSSSPSTALKPEQYSHSPAHYAVITKDYTALSNLISTLPKLADPDHINTEQDSLAQEHIADEISAVLDRRDVPNNETPLHLAVRLNDASAAESLASAGANISSRNKEGWNSIQEACCHRHADIALLLKRIHVQAEMSKWRRRLPRFVAELRRMRDFYMEISFHFESSVIPFMDKIAPSDTYKIWKIKGNLRADTTIGGFDGMKIQRKPLSLYFLGEGDHSHGISCGSLVAFNREDKSVCINYAYDKAKVPMTEAQARKFRGNTKFGRPRMDLSNAELVPKLNWRRQEKTEKVGEWKAKVYDMHNVVFRFRTREIGNAGNEGGEGGDGTKEKEFVKSLKPSVWLTKQFPLKIEEVLPLLDILSKKVKAVRRMREFLTTTFPTGSFPVKVAIPVVATVRVVITFTQFMEIHGAGTGAGAGTEQFYTPFSSPSRLPQPQQEQHSSCKGVMECSEDPFEIPRGNTWFYVDARTGKRKKMNVPPKSHTDNK